MVTTGWAYDVCNMSHSNPVQIINLVEKYEMHAFNKANTVMTVATEFFCCSCCSLGHVK